MDALILAVAALIFSRLVAPETISPYRDRATSLIESITNLLPNQARLPVLAGGAIAFGAIIAHLPLVGVLVTFLALVGILRFGEIIQSSQAILGELRNGSLSQAQVSLSAFSNTDASQLDENGVARLAIETQVVKLANWVFSPLAWFALGGLPGLLLVWISQIVANRQGAGDASKRWLALLNWVPYRLMAFSIGLMGDRERSRAIWKHQAQRFSDPEVGILVAATAGALGVQLGGSRSIAGLIRQEPLLGDGQDAARYHIGETQSLAERSLLLWAVASLVISVL